MEQVRKVADFVGRWLAVFVLAGAAIGLLAPSQAASLAPAITPALGIIMFGMGLTLRPVDFAVVARHPLAVVVGVIAQFLLMPLLGWGIGQVFGLTGVLLAGMVLVGSAPGGTASNVVVYLAKGDVALSVAMTSVSTLLAPLLTPLLVLWLAGSELPVDTAGLMTSIAQVVLIPVLLGLVVRRFLSKLVERILPILPLVSVAGILLVVTAVVGGSKDTILTSGLLLFLAVILHNGLGLLLGYAAARLIGIDESGRRAISIEVGMQNSGLAAALATTHFSPAAALPAAIFSIWHNVSGALVATFWSRRPVKETEPSGGEPE
ncbi:bile acid:sodium symporter family protein [Glycomyces buryatensis]|uniref:Bile acid:sodium symporter family protein n=1 Tax=Glycomyces buryatensis TaxID=2570927 RepID=A0A4S8QQK5_9ACTN|nr:bile acid:sodium symporter family protein [Glycomyces buryatensis]THV43004.1 bile acid:sodium symporter family protein [Glycomyces buryatensis]